MDLAQTHASVFLETYTEKPYRFYQHVFSADVHGRCNMYRFLAFIVLAQLLWLGYIRRKDVEELL